MTQGAGVPLGGQGSGLEGKGLGSAPGCDPQPFSDPVGFCFLLCQNEAKHVPATLEGSGLGTSGVILDAASWVSYCSVLFWAVSGEM